MPPPAPGCASCASRDVVIEELASANARLVERVAGLERLVGRNSDNSSRPPSTDDLPGRKAPSRKTGKRSERRRGKQPGAAGAGLSRVDNPDETVQVFPETCADCGAGLADGADAGVSSRQVFDLPPVTVRVTEYMAVQEAVPVRLRDGGDTAGGGGRRAGQLRPEPAGFRRLPAGLPACPGAPRGDADRGPDRGAALDRLRARHPAPLRPRARRGHDPGQDAGDAGDGGRVRRDHVAVRPGRPEELRAVSLDRAVHTVLPGWPGRTAT